MRQRNLAVAGLGVLGIGPVTAVAGGWTPLAGVAAAIVSAALFRMPPPWSGSVRTAAVLELLCGMCAAGVLARGFGDYLVPGYGRAAGIAMLAVGGVGVGLRARCPGVLVWFTAVLAGVAGALFVGAGLGIAPAPHPAGSASPWLLPLGAGLLLAPAAAAGSRRRSGFPWWPLGAAAAFALLAAVTVWQLGAPRAAPAHAPMADALAAADATALVPALAVGVALLCAVGAYGQLEVAARRVPVVLATLGAAVLTLPDQWIALLACSLLAVLRWATTSVDDGTGRGTPAGGGQLR